MLKSDWSIINPDLLITSTLAHRWHLITISISRLQMFSRLSFDSGWEWLWTVEALKCWPHPFLLLRVKQCLTRHSPLPAVTRPLPAVTQPLNGNSVEIIIIPLMRLHHILQSHNLPADSKLSSKDSRILEEGLWSSFNDTAHFPVC